MRGIETDLKLRQLVGLLEEMEFKLVSRSKVCGEEFLRCEEHHDGVNLEWHWDFLLQGPRCKWTSMESN